MGGRAGTPAPGSRRKRTPCAGIRTSAGKPSGAARSSSRSPSTSAAIHPLAGATCASSRSAAPSLCTSRRRRPAPADAGPAGRAQARPARPVSSSNASRHPGDVRAQERELRRGGRDEARDRPARPRHAVLVDPDGAGEPPGAIHPRRHAPPAHRPARLRRRAERGLPGHPAARAVAPDRELRDADRLPGQLEAIAGHALRDGRGEERQRERDGHRRSGPAGRSGAARAARRRARVRQIATTQATSAMATSATHAARV